MSVVSVPSDPGVVLAARSLAADVLFPAALAVDASASVPRSHLDALAAAGLYGLVGVEPAVAARVAEELASGCLTTAFVWLQHVGAVARVADSWLGGRVVSGGPPSPALDPRTAAGEGGGGLGRPAVLASEPGCAGSATWVAALSSGSVRAGIAFSALRRPGPPALVATPRDGGGWSLRGVAPWVTGWGRIDVIFAAARCEEDIVWFLLDANEQPGLEVTPLSLIAVQASGTVTLGFDGVVVAPERVAGVERYDAWTARDRAGPNLRMNSSLSLGLADRCNALAGDDRWGAAIDAARTALDRSAPDAMPRAHARATALALDAATTLVVERGGSAVLHASHEQRLAREALFLQVFSQTRPVREAQLALRHPPHP